MKHVLIFADCGDDVGHGHIKRCHAIAEQLKDRFNVTLFIRDTSSYPHKDIEYQMINEFDYSSISHYLIINGIELSQVGMIFDSFLMSRVVVDELESKFNKTIFIDDYIHRDYQSSLVVDWTVGAEKKEQCSVPGCVYLFGSQYVCLRKPFYTSDNYVVNKTISKVTTVFGGTDIRNMTPRIVKLLKSIDSEITVNCFITSSYPSYNDLNLFEQLGANVIVNSSCEQMVSEMLSSDLIITAGGQTIYEIACLAVPSISINVIDNQLDDLMGMANEKCSQFISDWDDCLLQDKFVSAYSSLDYKTRLSLSDNAKRLGLKKCSIVKNIVEYLNE